MATAKQIALGSLNGLSADQRDLFDAARNGNKKIIKKLIESGRIKDVDTKNDEGQTPLFFACYGGHEESVKLLLDKGANPNETTEKLQTPLHAACYNCNVKSVSALVERGGDFRFHDKDQRTGKDFALMNPDAKKRAQMTEYIVKTRMFAMTHSGRDVLLEHQSSSYMRKASDNAGSIPQLFRRLSSKGGGKGEQIKASASLMSLGYGKVYGGERGGTISTIPMIAESMLKHDDYGTTFMNSAFFVMEGMMLGPTKVTVKRLHHDPPKGGVVDHLIRECENIAVAMDDKIQPTPKSGWSKRAKRKVEDIIETDSDSSTSTTSKRKTRTRSFKVAIDKSLIDAKSEQESSTQLPKPMPQPITQLVPEPTSQSVPQPITQLMPQPLPQSMQHLLPQLVPLPQSVPQPITATNSMSTSAVQSHQGFIHQGGNYIQHLAPSMLPFIGLPINGFSNPQPPNLEALMFNGHALPPLLGFPSASAVQGQPASKQCSMCREKDGLLDIQNNMIQHLQHIVAVARNAVPLVQNMESNYMRIAVRQGRIPRYFAQRNNMFEIPIETGFQSGVFLTPSFKYDLQLNYSERGTLIAKKMLHAFFTEYDLAYAGGLFALNGKPGIDSTILTAIECFASRTAKAYVDKPSIRSTLSAEISAACTCRETKGLKAFQKNRLLENPNNIPPTVYMPFVVSDISELMSQRSNC